MTITEHVTTMKAEFMKKYDNQHRFFIEDAKEYGIEEAIILANFKYWIDINTEKEVNFFDGRYWVYNSIKELNNRYPYMSEPKIRRVIDSLVKKGVLIKGNYNSNTYDRTLWYSINENCMCRNRQMDSSESTIGIAENDKSYIEDNITDSNNYERKEIQKKEFDEEQFNQWWELYDYKVDKTKAMKSWAKMTDLERSEALSSVVWYVEATTTSNAPRDPLKPFIPKRKNPTTWLNGRCWEDEAYKPKPNPYQEEIDRLDKLAKDKWDELLQWEQKGREQNTHFWDEIGALQREVKNANIMSKYWKDKWEVEKNSK